jgi:hypothetical protein
MGVQFSSLSLNYVPWFTGNASKPLSRYLKKKDARKMISVVEVFVLDIAQI